MKRLLFILFLIISLHSFAQVNDKNEALAKQYYRKGNFSKAVILLEDLFNAKEKSNNYYSMYFNTLLALEEFTKAEKVVKKQIRKYKGVHSFEIDLAYLYAQNNDNEKAEKIYEKVINSLTAEEHKIRSVAYKFASIEAIDYLLSTYNKGNKLFKNENKFAYEIAETYFKLSKYSLAVDYWLNFLEDNESQKVRIQSLFTRHLSKDGFAEAIETGLYKKIQTKPKDKTYPELLIWLFTNLKDFESAFIQAKALDKKYKENGYRMIVLAKDAFTEENYSAAIKIYEYILTKGESSSYNKMAKSSILKARKQALLKNNDYSRENILALKAEYEDYLTNYGSTVSNANTMRELANLKANYLDDVAGGIELITAILKFPNLKKKQKNELKLDLGDMYILSGDVWESVLIYAQVDKDEKDSPMGEDARFRNAKLSYYIGEFEWAQAQLTVLKGATTELIANDALKLSIFIIDNLGLDTSTAAIEMYSDAELLIIQHKYDEAIVQLDKILVQFPGHVLEDDIFLKKAEIFLMLTKYLQAESILLKLLNRYRSDILADNATFMLAELYDNQLNVKEKAKEYYKKIIVDYSNSVLLVKARKRYRILREDSL